ncbi:MAG: hybrid sensor histidine kinase/response regulator [Bdellovibrionales bacterium]|nr:hybrid sensor histidine kinase/response regulator [Bdellovibrionales bacterium]
MPKQNYSTYGPLNKSYKILYIDTCSKNTANVIELLSDHFKIHTAASVKEALLLIDDISFSLIISQVILEKQTGIDFFKQVKETNLSDSIRILITDKNTKKNTLIEAINNGDIYHYLKEGYSPSELQNLIYKALKQYEAKLTIDQKDLELKKAYSDLKELDKSKTQFMMLINHELKTPLTNIINFISLLKVSKLNDEQEKYLNYIEGSTGTLKKLIDESLSFISAETGQLKLNKNIVSIPALLQSPLEKLQKKIKNKKQSLDLKICDDKIKIDIKIIQQILNHLLHNAIKFGPENSEISFHVTKSDNLELGSLKFSISNTGKEVPKDIVEKIFKPFVLNEQNMNHSQGFGLGLSLCQALLKVHKSQLKFTNSNNITSVYFYL